jgi:hypothetical protein
MNEHIHVLAILEDFELTSSKWGRIQMIPSIRRNDGERKVARWWREHNHQLRYTE